MSPSLRLECQQQICWNSALMIYFGFLSFFSYSFEVKKTNTFISSRGSLENHTRFQTVMVKIYTRFQTKTPQKPYPSGQRIHCTYIADIGSTPWGVKPLMITFLQQSCFLVPTTDPFTKILYKNSHLQQAENSIQGWQRGWLCYITLSMLRARWCSANIRIPSRDVKVRLRNASIVSYWKWKQTN